MPGRLMMDQQIPVGAQDLKKDRSQAQIAQKHDLSQMQNVAQINGSAHGLSNGTRNGLPSQSQPPSTTNGLSNGASISVSRLPTPPPLDQSWRTSDANKPMGVLLSRLAQQCFTDLNDALNKMNDMPAPQPVAANGVIPHTADPSPESQARKRLLMEFANGQRDRFIKALVLSDWARSELDMAKLVDLKIWLDSQIAAQENAMQFIGITKHDVARAKMPNPNIEGAMELLATGKASSRWPDLGYIAPPKLTSKQLIGTLQDMNVTISTRLNLHEELPPHLRDYSIADGRVTFRVPGEFEVDLSVADEDPTSQFYLIDLRFNFTPTPALTDDVLRNALESQTNEALSTKGLSGCYDFLHNFVLTHKINVLKSQSVQLFREKWFDCLVTESQRRVLAIQYWKQQAGKKSWIEFGIGTGKPKGKQTRRSPTAQQSVRWFRQGQEVHDDKITVDWDNLDLDAILAQVTAKHASWSLSVIRDRLQAVAGSHSKVNTRLSTSSSCVGDCKLELAMPGLRTTVTIHIESVTGLATVSPATRDAAMAQRNLNRDPTVDNSSSIAQLLCRAVQDRLRRTAVSSGWQLVDLRGFAPQPNFRALFGADVVRHDIFSCSKAWSEEWALCTTYSLSGEKWWVVRTQRRADDQGRSMRTIKSARSLDVTTAAPSRADLMRIQTMGEAEVSFAVLAEELETHKIPHHFERLSSLTSGDERSEDPAPAMVYMRLSSHDVQKPQFSNFKSLATTEWIRIAYEGVVESDEHGSESRHDIHLTIASSKLRQLKSYLTRTRSQGADVVMNESGGLALSLRTQFGHPYVTEIGRLLSRCHELDNAITAAAHMGYICTVVGLKKLAFTYGASQQYTGDLICKGSNTFLKLGPASSNPHQRIRKQLEANYNSATQGPFWQLAYTMAATQPLLEALTNLESNHVEQRSMSIHARSVFKYKLAYSAPMTPCNFTIIIHWSKKQPNAVKRRDYQYTLSLSPRPGSELPGDFQTGLFDLSKDAGSKAEGYFGNNKGGYTAYVHGLPVMLQRVDEYVQSFIKNADGPVKKQENQQTPLPDVKPPLNRKQSKTQVPAQQKPTIPPQAKMQARPPQNLPRPGQDNTARQMTVPMAQVQRQNQNHARPKQEVIELD